MESNLGIKPEQVTQQQHERHKVVKLSTSNPNFYIEHLDDDNESEILETSELEEASENCDHESCDCDSDCRPGPKKELLIELGKNNLGAGTNQSPTEICEFMATRACTSSSGKTNKPLAGRCELLSSKLSVSVKAKVDNQKHERNAKVSNTRLFSRRERTDRRQLRNNNLSTIDCEHDGDIDKSDDDECEDNEDSDCIIDKSVGEFDGTSIVYGARCQTVNSIDNSVDSWRKVGDKNYQQQKEQQVFLRSRKNTKAIRAERNVYSEDNSKSADISSNSDSSQVDLNAEFYDIRKLNDSFIDANNNNYLNDNTNSNQTNPSVEKHSRTKPLDASHCNQTTHRCSIIDEQPEWTLWSVIKNFLSTDRSSVQRKRHQKSGCTCVRLKRCNIVGRNRSHSDSNKSIEWKSGGSAVSYKSQSNMSRNNYGTEGSSGHNSLYSNNNLRSNRRSSSSRKYRRSLLPGSNMSGYSRLDLSQYNKPTRQSWFQELKRLLLLLAIIFVCGLLLWQVYEILIQENNYLSVAKSDSILGQFQDFAVSTDAKPCAIVGKNLLLKGGNAVDAAIGTLICMGVVLPNSLGLGGGCLMTIYDNQTKKAMIIDGRETAPDYAFEKMFTVENMLAASRGPLSIGVPGELAAYWEAHKRFGKLKWSQLFEGGIEYAEKGVPVVEHLSYALRDWTHAQYISPPLAKLFMSNKTGQYVHEGEILIQPKLADTLKRIRDNGVNEFYNGTTGQLFIDDLRKQGGKMTMENLSKYSVRVEPAIEFQIANDLKLYTQSLPGSGLVLSIILRIMKGLGYYKNTQPRETFEASSLYYHHLAEAFKFAYAQRGGLEDMPDDPVGMEKLIARLSSEQFIEDTVRAIDNRTHSSSYYGGAEFFKEDHGTAHVSVVDSQGMSVAVTSSVNLYFGSGLVSPSTGIIYNDVMDDFVSPNITNKFGLLPSEFNRIKPGRRPVSSMTPSVYVNEHGNPLLIIGASGGTKITTAIASVTMRNLFVGDDIKTAIDAPRIHHQYKPNQLYYESNFPLELRASLANRFHKLVPITGRSSVVMAIACSYEDNSKKLIMANSDYRKGGSVAGQ